MADAIEENEDTATAELDPFTAGLAEQGFAIDGGLPVNHRLRAEALAKAGRDTDPAGAITPEAIAAAGERLAAEAKDEAADAPPAVKPSMPVADLKDIADREGVDLSDATNNDQRVAAIEAARAGNEG
jgi:hypothetical protein